MSALDRLQGLLEAQGASHVFRFGSRLLWGGEEASYLAHMGDNPVGEDVLIVYGLSPEQAAMATLGDEGCPMAASGAMRCDGAACGCRGGGCRP